MRRFWSNDSIFYQEPAGFNQTHKHTVVCNWIQAAKLSISCLVETPFQEAFSSSIIQSTITGWSYSTKYEYHRLGRLWICCSNEIDVNIIYKSAQTIACSVKFYQTGVVFLCSFIYALNLAVDIHDLWNDLTAVKNVCVTVSTPCIVLGEFNEILYIKDHSCSLEYLSDRSSMSEIHNVVFWIWLTLVLSFHGRITMMQTR